MNLPFFRRPKASHLRMTFYSRAGCACCETARAVIEPRQKRHGFEVEFVDIDTDPALVEAHGDSVPVIAIDGRVRFRGKVEPALLDRLLDAEARRGAQPIEGRT